MSTAPTPRRISTRAFLLVGLSVAALIACVLSAVASGHPDGLEYVAEQAGFLTVATDSWAASSPFADYTAVFVGSPWLSTALAGAVGCAVTFAFAWLLGRVAARRHDAR